MKMDINKGHAWHVYNPVNPSFLRKLNRVQSEFNLLNVGVSASPFVGKGLVGVRDVYIRV